MAAPSMSVLLISPPLNSLTHPHASLPVLTAFLRARGVRVVQRDLGIEVMEELFSAAGIAALGGRIRRKAAAEDPERGGKRLREALLMVDVVAEGIEAAKGVMRDREAFYDPERYLHAHRLLARGFDLIEAAHPNLRFNGDALSMRHPATFDSCEAFAADPESHPFHEAIQRRLAELVGSGPFDWIGLSVTYTGQLHFAFALARMAHELFPGVPVVMGGAAISLAEDTLRRFAQRAFALADGFVFGEGEGPLGNLLNLVCDPAQAGGIHKNLMLSPAVRARFALPDDLATIAPVTDLDQLPTPDYGGLDLSRYLTPEPIFFLGNTRTCYYGQCAFCSCGYGHKGRYAIRSMAKIEQDLRTLKERFGARCLFFTDDCLPPKRGREIAEFLHGAGLDFVWSAWLRYEKSFDDDTVAALVRSGLRQVSFGNESGSAQMLETMRKGTDPQRGVETIRRMAAHGVGIDLQNFIGFPGETHEQAQETVRFLVALKTMVTTCAFGAYYVAHGSPVALEPTAFGVSDLRLIDPERLIPSYHYTVDRGPDPAELPDLYKRFAGFIHLNFLTGTFFLELGIGAHTLLYHERYGSAWVCSRLPLLLRRRGQWQSGDRWGDGVRRVLHPDGSLSAFDSHSGVLLRVEQGQGCLAVLEGGADVPDAKVRSDLNLLFREGLVGRERSS